MSTVDISVAEELPEQIRYVDDLLVDEIWKKLGGRVKRARVYAVAQEVEREFSDVAVTTFIPIFIRRLTYERLTAEINTED